MLRRCASVWPDKKELPGGGAGMVSAGDLSSEIADLSVVAAWAAAGFGAGSAFGVGCTAIAEEVGGREVRGEKNHECWGEQKRFHLHP